MTLDYLWPLVDDPKLMFQGSTRPTPRRHFPLPFWKGRKFGSDSPSACSQGRALWKGRKFGAISIPGGKDSG